MSNVFICLGQGLSDAKQEAHIEGTAGAAAVISFGVPTVSVVSYMVSR